MKFVEEKQEDKLGLSVVLNIQEMNEASPKSFRRLTVDEEK